MKYDKIPKNTEMKRRVKCRSASNIFRIDISTMLQENSHNIHII